MRDTLLYASGTLGLVAAFLHGLLGETRVFARARIEPERLGRLIRGVWHCSAGGVGQCRRPSNRRAVDGLADGATLDRLYSYRYLGFSAIVNAWVLRGRNFGWILLAIIVALALGGL